MAHTELTDSDIQAANARAAARLARSPTATTARFDKRKGQVVVELSSGLQIAFKPGDAQGLEAATATELQTIEISPSGLGLHFPKVDADLYIPALLEGFLGSRSWMAQRMGSQGGLAVSKAKSEAARANGKLGGRPRTARKLKAA